jgi:hypothetical protein
MPTTDFRVRVESFLRRLGRSCKFVELAEELDVPGGDLGRRGRQALRARLKAAHDPPNSNAGRWLHAEAVVDRETGKALYYMYSLPPADDAGLDARRASHAAEGALPNVTPHNPPATSAAPATPTRHCA